MCWGSATHWCFYPCTSSTSLSCRWVRPSYPSRYLSSSHRLPLSPLPPLPSLPLPSIIYLFLFTVGYSTFRRRIFGGFYCSVLHHQDSITLGARARNGTLHEQVYRRRRRGEKEGEEERRAKKGEREERRRE